jgi:hypothetical protein
MKLNIKIWSWAHAVNCADDWFFDRDLCADLDTVLAQPYRIAAVPVMFNEPHDFAYQPAADLVDLSQFDLVLLSDIEYRPREWVEAWIQKNRIQRWALLQGGIDLSKQFDHAQCAYRPWWIYHRDLKFNQYQEISAPTRPYVFDVLLGSRRPNRDFVMLALQQSQRLNQNIVTFRDVFPGSQVNRASQQVQDYFAGTELAWPYIGPTLRPEWEVTEHINNTVSQTVPWSIYSNTWFSVAAESVCQGSIFFMAEKISKPMFARRPFVVFGIRGFLQQLRALGYQTFDPVIDESYDLIDNDLERWQAAFDQMVRLMDSDPADVCSRLQGVVEHNRQRLLATESIARHDIEQLLLRNIPQQYVIAQSPA